MRGVGTNDANAFAATMEEVYFLGAFWRVHLRGDGFTLRADFSANLVRDLDLREGARIVVALPPDRILVFRG